MRGVRFALLLAAPLLLGAARESPIYRPAWQADFTQCRWLDDPGKDRFRIELLKIVQSAELSAERLAATELCVRAGQSNALLADFDEERLALTYNPKLVGGITLAAFEAGNVPLTDAFEVVDALAYMALFRNGDGDAHFRTLELASAVVVGETLAKGSYSDADFARMVDRMETFAKPGSLSAERVAALRRSFRLERERQRAATSPSAPTPQDRPPPPAETSPPVTAPVWHAALSSFEHIMDSIGTVGGGIVMLYGGYRWMRRRKIRPRKPALSAPKAAE